MIRDSEEEPSERKNIIVEIEDESDEEKHDVPSNNQMTLRHDEEFPMRIPEMETEGIHRRDVSGNDLSERHVPDTSHNEQVSDIYRTPDVQNISDTEEVSSHNHSDSHSDHIDNDPTSPKPILKWIKDHPENANSLFECFISNIEPKTIDEALRDQDWISAMQEELDQFERNKV